MKVIEVNLSGVKIIENTCFKDERGVFFESWNQRIFSEQVAKRSFVQDNHSISSKGVLRGLHYQEVPFEQGKLVRVSRGKALDVIVDIRPDSPTFTQHMMVELSEENNRQLWIPEGFAHGFLALEDETHFQYKTTNYYDKEYERVIKWDSPELNISWPADIEFKISDKDRVAPNFGQILTQLIKP